MRHAVALTAALMLALPVPGFAGPPPGGQAAGQDPFPIHGGEISLELGYFDCEGFGDGGYSVTIYADDPSQAEAVNYNTGSSGYTIPMFQEPTASGFRYTGEGVELRGQGVQASMTAWGETRPCVYYETDVFYEDPYAPLPTRARSFGGNLRAGPGIDYSDIGSVPAYTDITLVEDSGQDWGGYTWYYIQMDNGIAGYHWGGIICAPYAAVAGVYEVCD